MKKVRCSTNNKLFIYRGSLEKNKYEKVSKNYDHRIFLYMVGKKNKCMGTSSKSLKNFFNFFSILCRNMCYLELLMLSKWYI